MIIARTLIITSLFSCAAFADGKGIPLDELPAAAQATIKAHTANAKILDISREKDAFEVETRLDGKSHNLVVDEQGRLCSIEDEVALDAVPEKVRATIRKEAGSARILGVEKVTEGNQVSYDADLKTSKNDDEIEIRVREDGSLKWKHEEEDDDNDRK